MSSKNKIHTVLATAYKSDTADRILEAYNEIQNNFVLRKWKPSELDAGHFVELIRRIIEQELFGTTPSFGTPLPKFNESVLKSYESGTGHESFRILIPRVLFSVYTIRNKRGVGHVGEVSPNELDATHIVYSAKWVLAEVVRLKSDLSIADTLALVENIVERLIPAVWTVGNMKRVQVPGMPALQQVLVLLLDTSPIAANDLQQMINYKNTHDFKKLLKSMHTKKLIEYDGSMCHISPIGARDGDKILIANRI